MIEINGQNYELLLFLINLLLSELDLTNGADYISGKVLRLFPSNNIIYYRIGLIYTLHSFLEVRLKDCYLSQNGRFIDCHVDYVGTLVQDLRVGGAARCQWQGAAAQALHSGLFHPVLLLHYINILLLLRLLRDASLPFTIVNHTIVISFQERCFLEFHNRKPGDCNLLILRFAQTVEFLFDDLDSLTHSLFLVNADAEVLS